MNARSIKSIRIDKLAGVKAPPYLVKGVLTAGATSVVYGEPKSRKSFLMLDVALHIALGRPWCDRKVLQGPVVYVVAEGFHSINNRVEAFFKHHGIERAGVPLYIMQPISLGGDGKDDADAVVVEIERQGIEPVLIVLDTLNRTMLGDENSTRDMSSYVRRIDYMREKTRAHVSVVHHCGKNKDLGARGSSALKGAVDTEALVERDDDLSVFTVQVQRDLPEDFRQVFEFDVLEVGHDDDDPPEAITSIVALTSEREPTSDGDQQQDKALRSLRDLCAQQRNKNDGKIADAPEFWYVARVGDWRRACHELPLSKGKDRAKRAAFSRSLKVLVEDGRVKLSADEVWAGAEWAGGGGEQNPPPVGTIPMTISV